MNKHGLYDIYGPHHVPFWQTKAFFIAWVVFGICIGIMLILYLVMLYKKRKPVLPVWVVTIQEIERLRQTNKLGALEGKQVYGNLTKLLKNYIFGRFGIDCFGKTDKEMLDYLKQQHFDISLVQKLEEIFSGGVIIKFANAQAIQEHIELDLQRSITFVQDTIPQSNK